MNNISLDEIQHQLFFFSKEAIKNIVLQSKCGIIHTSRNHKKHSDNTDDNIFKNYSPLICIYKKASPQPETKDSLSWDPECFKKNVLIISNALMTLCILELAEYYSHFENINENLYKFSNIYKKSAKNQLEFYSAYLRNSLGVFVDKKVVSSEDISFVNKNDKFKYSDQAFMMNAYYLYSKMCPEDKDSEVYKDFSSDILNMLIDFKEELYHLSFTESSRLCLALNTYCIYSGDDKAKELLIDILDLCKSNYMSDIYNSNNIETESLFCINLYLLYKLTGYSDAIDTFLKVSEKQISLFDQKSSMFCKASHKKNITYSCNEIINYIVNGVLYHEVSENKDTQNIISSFYKEVMLRGSLVTSWPKIPNIDSPERYRNYSLKSDEMLAETYFSVPNLNPLELTGLMPIFNKEITYSRKKECFTSAKNTFYSEKNMLIFFISILLFRKNVFKTTNLQQDI